MIKIYPVGILLYFSCYGKRNICVIILLLLLLLLLLLSSSSSSSSSYCFCYCYLGQCWMTDFYLPGEGLGGRCKRRTFSILPHHRPWDSPLHIWLNRVINSYSHTCVQFSANGCAYVCDNDKVVRSQEDGICVSNNKIPVAARSKAWAFGRSPAEIVGSNPTRGMDVCLLWVLCVVR